MRRYLQLTLFLLGAAGALALLVWGVTSLPAFGRYPGPYGDQVIRHAVSDRHATNAVTTVVMDIRAVDTAGEELILYGAVIGVLMLLRRQKDEIVTEERAGHDPSIAVRAVTSWLVAPTALFAWYIIIHGAVTPGGGFQGGTILAVPTVVLLLSGRRRAFERLHRNIPWEIGQAIAVAGFLVFGFTGLASSAGAFLTNFLPLGSAGTVFSAGSITMLNLVAGVAVATAIVLLVIDLRHQLVEVQPR